jgi:hypothetical protein
MTLDLEQMRSCWNCCSTHWRDSPSDASGVNRHRITSRSAILAIRSKQVRRRWNLNIASGIASVYEIFLGGVPTKPLLVERSKLDAKTHTD